MYDSGFNSLLVQLEDFGGTNDQVAAKQFQFLTGTIRRLYGMSAITS